MKMNIWTARFAALALFVSIPSACRDSNTAADTDASAASLKLETAAAKRGQEVHGTVIAGLPRNRDGHAAATFIPIPDVQVWIEEVSGGGQSTPVTTDLAGRYIIPRQPEGKYILCWSKSGWITECTTSSFHLATTTHFPGLTVLRPQTSDGSGPTGVVRGRAQLADDSSCWYESEFFAHEQTARVELVSLTGQVIQDIRANDHGDFVLTHVPNTFFQIRTTCGSEILRTGFLPSNVDMTGATPIAPLVVPNSRPTVTVAAAYESGAGVRSVQAGAVVDVIAEASDPDGDPLSYVWKVQDGSGTLSASTTSSVEWTLPSAPGRYALYTMVSDNRGGVQQYKTSLQVESQQVVFSGRVKGSDGAELEGAMVTVNGARTEAGPGGAFALTLERVDSYVLHIEAEGYAEIGKRVDLALAGNTWVLTRAARQIIDPTVDNVIVDDRPEWLEPRDEDRRRRPARVHLRANSLVDADGNPADTAAGPFSAYIATIDPSSETMPGDFGAINLDGDSRYLVSFGAVFIEVRDADGGKYNLAPGASAQLESPVQDALLAGPVPPKMDMWTYDVKSGDWLQDPDPAELVGTTYMAELTSFSTHNADVQKVDPACIRIVVDANVLALGNLIARVDVAIAPGDVRRYNVTVDDQNNVLYNLPDNAPFTLELFQGVAPADSLIHGPVAGNTGSPWSATAGAPPYPYTDCDAAVTVNFPTLPAAFLQYGKGTGNAAQAAGYYAAIDPLNQRTTLGDWWSQNGFNPVTGAGGIRTSFGNDNDLGFGRDMHCRANGSDVACYVTNYGEPDQDPGNADLAQAAIQANAIATVTMEYSAVSGFPANDRIVKFYVYQGGLPGGVRLDSADLDKAGPKFVPNLCLGCHGGNYNPTNPASPTFNDINAGASFREFDTYTFTYPATNSQIAQEPNFHAQNQLVLDSNPAPAIVELITQFYAGGPTVDPNAVPTGWQAAQTSGSAAPAGLYLDVVGKSCRTCHVAQPEYNPLVASPSAYPDWNTYTMFRNVRQFAYQLVCFGKQMPNAGVTFKNFWLSLSPHRPESFEDFVDPVSGWPTTLENDFGAPCAP